MEFSDYVSIVRRRWLHILFIFLILGGGLSGWTWTRESLTYSAEARIGLREARSIIVTPTDLAPYVSAEQLGYGIYTQEALLTSRPVFDMAAALFLAFRDSKEAKTREFWKQDNDGQIVQALIDKGYATGDGSRMPPLWTVDSKKVRPAADLLMGSVTTGKPSDRVQLIHVRATAVAAEDAILMANCFARAAQMFSAEKSRSLVESALRNIEEQIRKSDERLKSKRRDIGMSEEELKEHEARLAQAAAALAEAERRVEEAHTRREQTAGRIDTLQQVEHRRREAVPGGAGDAGFSSPLLDRLRGEMTGIRTEIRMKTLEWTPANPNFQKMNARLAQLREEERLELDRLRAQSIVSLRQALDDIDVDLENLEERKLGRKHEIVGLTEGLRSRDPDRAEVVRLSQEVSGYLDVSRRLKLSRDVQRGFYVFEDPAEEAGAQQRRAMRVIPLYALVSLIVALALAFLMEYLDTTIRSDYDLKRHLNLPCLALVEHAGGSDPVIASASPRDPLSELFNVSATILRSYLGEREFKTCVICSAVPREGKTTVAANLAVAMARKGVRVALVDTDLRIPQMHRIFGLSDNRGLTGYLAGEAGDLDEFMQPAAGIPTLRILPCGPVAESPIELLESPRMAEALRTLRERFDIVLFDSPPLTSVGDALTLTRMVDTTLLVVGSGLADRRVVTWAKHLLANVRADIAGAVLNFARRREGTSYYYYSYGYSQGGKSVRTRD